MTLKEFVKTLADRIARLEQSGGGGGDVSKEYVDTQDTKLGNRITTLNSKVNKMKTDDIDPLTNSVSALQSDVGTLQASMTTTQDDISTLQDDVQTLTDTIPTKTSDLTNDSGFITSSALPTKTSDLTNDSGFVNTDGENTLQLNGENFYPITQANLVKTSDGETIESKLSEKANKDYVLHQSVSGNKVITLPSSYSELMVEVRSASNVYNFPIIKAQLSSTQKEFRLGYGANNFALIYATSTTIKLQVNLESGSNVSGATTTTVYYR